MVLGNLLPLLLLLLAALASGYPARPTSGKEAAEEPPPVPFEYKFSAGRAPGGKPDRYVNQKGDEHGVVQGSYTYLDPNWKWRKVAYVADEGGFHVLPGSTPVQEALPEETPVVAAARAKHEELFAAIAQRNSQVPVAPAVGNAESVAVARKRAEHEAQFAAIAAEHERIAEAHRRAQAEEESRRGRAEGGARVRVN